MTFARIVKLLAVLLVAFALWRARPPTPPAHLVVLALPGAPVGLVTPDSRQTTLAKGNVSLPAGTAAAAFWRRLLALEDDGTVDPARLAPLWSAEPASVRVFAVPARLFGAAEEAAVVDGAFVGSSAGVIVEAADITSGRLPSPYDRAADAVAAAAATLRHDEWSDWITVEPIPRADRSAQTTPVAQFQFARYTDSSYFFSPAYVPGPLPSVGQPFFRGNDRELRPIVAVHAVALSRRRLEPSRELFARGSDQRPAVVFDTVAEDATESFAPDSTPAALLEQVRDAIAAEITALREAVGDDGVLLVIGGPSTMRKDDAGAWYRILASGSHTRTAEDDAATSPMEFNALRAVIRSACGFALDAADKALVPAVLATKIPVRAAIAPPPPAAKAKPPQSGWSASTLESVPGALGSGH